VRRDEGEIIEVFDVDDQSFMGSASLLSDSESPVLSDWQEDVAPTRRPKWIMIAALAAVIAVVAAMVFGGSTRAPSSTPATSAASTPTAPITLATLPPTTAADDADTAVDPDDTGIEIDDGFARKYAFEPPTGYSISAATTAPGNFGVVQSQVWLAGGVLAHDAPWVAITVVPLAPEYFEHQREEIFANAYPTTVGGDPAFVIAPPTGASGPTTVGLFRNNLAVYVEGTGSEFFLLAVAGSVSLDVDLTDSSEVKLIIASSMGEFDEYQLVADLEGYWGDVFAPDSPTHSLVAERGAGAVGISRDIAVISTGRPLDRTVELLALRLQAPTVFQSPDGSIGVAGILEPGFGGQAIATATFVDRNGWVVSATSSDGLAEVVALAQSSYVATNLEWSTWSNSAVASAKQPITRTGPATAFRSHDATTVTTRLQSTTVEDITTYAWLATVNIQTIFTSTSEVSEAFDGDEAVIRVHSSPNQAIVMATVPRGIGIGAELIVYPADATPITVPFTDVDSEFDVLTASTSFAIPGPFEAVVVDADGSVLTNWSRLPDG
jgi:hypothetical protein